MIKAQRQDYDLFEKIKKTALERISVLREKRNRDAAAEMLNITKKNLKFSDGKKGLREKQMMEIAQKYIGFYKERIKSLEKLKNAATCFELITVEISKPLTAEALGLDLTTKLVKEMVWRQCHSNHKRKPKPPPPPRFV